MTNTNFDILKGNIRSLMKAKNMTQEQLGDAIGMSQSNVNKCLKKGDGSRSFTLEQVCSLADLFETTTDDLLGRHTKKESLSAEEICQFLATLISKYKVVHFEHPIEETVLPPSHGYDVYEPVEKTTLKYDAFYFPNYITPPEYFDEYRLDDIQDEVRINGNRIPENMTINNFLHKFIDTFEKYDSGVYEEEDYKILVDAYYRILEK